MNGRDGQLLDLQEREALKARRLREKENFEFERQSAVDAGLEDLYAVKLTPTKLNKKHGNNRKKTEATDANRGSEMDISFDS